MLQQAVTDLTKDSQIPDHFDDDDSVESVMKKYGQSNELVRASYSMPLYCKRLILLGLCKISYSDDSIDIEDDDTFTFTVTASDWNAMYASGKHAYDHMKRAAIQLHANKTGALWFRGSKEYEGVRWFESIYYPTDENNKGQGYVRLVFHRRVRQELVQLTKGGYYTQVDLRAVCGFESTYSIRLYELCRQFHDTGLLIVPVSEFRRLFMLEDAYKRFTDLRTKVIEPSINEINTKAYGRKALKVKMVKKRATVDRLIFTFPRETR